MSKGCCGRTTRSSRHERGKYLLVVHLARLYSPAYAAVQPERWNGWGYEDTEFFLNASQKVALSGSRYLFSGKALPDLRPWMEEKAGLNIDYKSPSQTMDVLVTKMEQATRHLPDFKEQHSEFFAEISGQYQSISFDMAERIKHAHGHTCQV